MIASKHSVKFVLEKRKDKVNKELIIENTPVFMTVTYSGERLWYFSGYRIDFDKWDTNLQRVKKNTFNKDKISASIINARLTELENAINEIFKELKDIPSIDNLRGLLKTKLNEDTNKPKELNIFGYFEKYITDANVSPGRKKQLNSTLNHFKNFSEAKGLNLNFEKCNPETLVTFEKYLRSDPETPRSKNTITGILSRLRCFFLYAKGQAWTNKNPFEGYSIEPEVYGDPIYLTKKERDALYFEDIQNERLARVRDMFVLQCFIGCRVGDFVKLRKSNIIKGVLHYVPSKTQDENQKVCKVPLSEKALSIINKYDLPDGSLVPYITGQKYNEYLKELFRLVKLNRIVVRMNPLTRQNEAIPLHSIASSHMARRTFIGLLHKTTKNEVIASMSGHTENSKAFKRYYNIDEVDQQNAIKNIE